MKSIFAAAGIVATLCAPALAQAPAQIACKGYYVVGETVPAGCAQQTINSSNYATWGNGRPADVAPTASAPLFDPRSRGFMTR